MIRRIYSIALFGLLGLSACHKSDDGAFAYGNFEATEVIVSAQANGQLQQFIPQEGQSLQAGQMVGYVDTVQLYLKKQQLLASRKSIAARTGNIVSQIDVQKTQLTNLQQEQQRFQKLVAAQAATQKQLDDINNQVRVTEAQIKSLQTQNAPVYSDIQSIDAQIAQINDQIAKSIIRNPIRGTVLVKYTEPDEVVAFGKPLYSIANLDTIMLRVYVSGDQLTQVQLGQKVQVLVDNGNNGLDSTQGRISWIATQAEFTPKTVQTRDERVTLVYAVKVAVPNSGKLKIGMPGEMKIN